jgi:putative transposase
VSASMVVVPEPAVKGGGAFSARAVDGALGPAGDQGADEALCLSVCLRPVRAGAQVLDPEPATGDRVHGRSVRAAVVAEYALDADAVAAVEGEGAAKEGDRGRRLLVGEDLGVGEPAVVFLVDRTADGRPIKILTITDEYTREALATPAARRITADDTVDVLERVVAQRGSTPAYIRCDNGPELTAEALKDWCRFAGATTAYIEPGAPWQNPYIESFNGHLRDELLDLESFNTPLETQILLDDWRQDYNHHRPHQSLNYQTPAEFARQWHAQHTRTLITGGPKRGPVTRARANSVAPWQQGG